MRGRALPLIFVLLSSGAAQAQMTWQPTPPPLVTAENETWFRSGAAIEWNGELYYPAGAPEAFNRYQMVRAGSYRGIPLYTDATLEPYSIVFVPIAGGRLQPYERPRTGMLAGSVGSRTPSFPTSPATEVVGALGVSREGWVTQAPAPPTFARAYDLGAGPAVAAPASPSAPAPAATAGTQMRTSAPFPVARKGRATLDAGAAGTVRPKSINGAWIEYQGRRYVASGRAVDLNGGFTRVGDYRGFPVYRKAGDDTTIYVPSAGTLLVPYTRR